MSKHSTPTNQRIALGNALALLASFTLIQVGEKRGAVPSLHADMLRPKSWMLTARVVTSFLRVYRLMLLKMISSWANTLQSTHRYCATIGALRRSVCQTSERTRLLHKTSTVNPGNWRINARSVPRIEVFRCHRHCLPESLSTPKGGLRDHDSMLNILIYYTTSANNLPEKCGMSASRSVIGLAHLVRWWRNHSLSGYVCLVHQFILCKLQIGFVFERIEDNHIHTLTARASKRSYRRGVTQFRDSNGHLICSCHVIEHAGLQIQRQRVGIRSQQQAIEGRQCFSIFRRTVAIFCIRVLLSVGFGRVGERLLAQNIPSQSPQQNGAGHNKYQRFLHMLGMKSLLCTTVSRSDGIRRLMSDIKVHVTRNLCSWELFYIRRFLCGFQSYSRYQ